MQRFSSAGARLRGPRAGVAGCAIVLGWLAPAGARADEIISLLPAGWDGPDLVIYAGPSFGGRDQISPRPDPATCIRCSAGSTEPMDVGEPRRATVAVGLAGSEEWLRGGGELFSVLGFGGGSGASGYTGVVTYGGVDAGPAFAQVGLGIGTYWGGARTAEGLDLVAGTAHAELGVRIIPQLVVLGRGDLLVNGESVAPIASVGLQWIPGARTLRRARRDDTRPLFDAPAL